MLRGKVLSPTGSQEKLPQGSGITSKTQRLTRNWRVKLGKKKCSEQRNHTSTFYGRKEHRDENGAK